MYEFLTDKEHYITIRNRDGYSIRRRYWNINAIRKVLRNQKESEDIFVTKYPTGSLVKYIILDFDSKEDKSISLRESSKMMNYFERNGHPCVLVDSTNKGYHLYIKISPFLFKDTEMRVIPDWKLFFEGFVRYMIRNSSKTDYTTLDETNTSAGLGGNIRLINSIHPSTGRRVEIIHGEFTDDLLPPTRLQDEAQKFAYNFCESCTEVKENKRQSHTMIVDAYDPCLENDLRVIFPHLFGGEIKHYGDYSMMCCPFHCEEHPSLMIWKEAFKCLACGEKGNIWTLRKKGLLEFGIDGKVVY